MKHYFKNTPGEFVITTGWHSWDLSDCVMPKYVEDMFTDEFDIEEMDWGTILFLQTVNLTPEMEAAMTKLTDALNKWVFEAPVGDSEDEDRLVPTSKQKVLNQMLDDLAGVPERSRTSEMFERIADWIMANREALWIEHPRLDPKHIDAA